MKDAEEIEQYGDPGITSKDEDIPKWLLCTYLILPILGVLGMYWYWNGSHGFLDPGYWHQLQKAAHTTFPEPPPPQSTQFNR